MSFKRSVLSLALSVTMLAWATGHAFASPVLIRLELKSEAEYENARKLNGRHSTGSMICSSPNSKNRISVLCRTKA